MKRPPSHYFTALLLAVLCVALAPAAIALDPPPGGAYPNQTTALGEDAIFSDQGISFSGTAIGFHSLYSETHGADNTAVGSNALFALVSASFNTALGSEALSSSTAAGNNTAVGYQTLNRLIGLGHSDNTAVGYRAMANADSFACVAVGSEALVANTGQLNTAVGVRSLENNTSGQNNTVIGWASMNDNLTGANNAAVGLNALASNTTGNTNSVMGAWGAVLNTTGTNLATVGYQALYNNSTGSDNTAIGSLALFSNTKGSGNIALGKSAGDALTGDNNIAIGNSGVAGESGAIRIGTAGSQTVAYMAGIRETPLVRGDAVAVGITADGQLGVRASSARFKEAIHPMDKASEALLALQPVTFRYKKDPKAIPQFGLVAEEVAKVDSDLVAKDDSGKPYTVRYEAVNAMLLNEFLKEHRKVEEQGKEIAELKAALKEQAAQIQKVSARLESTRPVTQLVER